MNVEFVPRKALFGLLVKGVWSAPAEDPDKEASPTEEGRDMRGRLRGPEAAGDWPGFGSPPAGVSPFDPAWLLS